MAEDLPVVNYAGCYRWREGEAPKLAWHSHRCPEMIWMEEGRNRTLFPDGVVFECAPGSLILTPAEVPHRQIDLEFSTAYYVGFEPDSPELDTSLRQLQVGGDPHIGVYLKEIYTLFHIEESLEEANALLRALLLHLRRLERDRDRDRQNHPALLRAVRCLSDRRCANPTLEEIAAAAGLSASHLNALFRKHFGTSVMKMLHEKRMSRARMLLADPMKTVADVADLLGYRDANYFIRSFHKTHGCTPMQFRRGLPKSLRDSTWPGRT